jgi:hypothetical protein
MTHDELIQKAIEQLKDNKVTKEMLESPHVRDAAVVYFKIRPHSNCMLVLDSQTGEQITGHFSSDPLLREYMSHCRLPKEADDLAKEIHNGDWDRFPELAAEPTPDHVELLKELERRCPGWSEADYERALADGLSKSK